MKRFSGVLLCSDFDNTLVPTRQCFAQGLPTPALSKENREAILSFMEQGGLFAVASGRGIASFSQVVHTIPSNMPAILYNGAAIYHYGTRKFMRCIYMGPDIREKMEEISKRFPQLGMEFYGEGLEYYVVSPNAFTSRHAVAIGSEGILLPGPEHAPGPYVKVLLQGETPALQQAQRILEKEYSAIFSGENLLEVTEPRATKGAAVHYLAHRWGIRPENVYCVGDESNDLSMLRAARQGYVPADAAASVIAEPGMEIVASCQNHCLPDVLQRLEKRYPE